MEIHGNFLLTKDAVIHRSTIKLALLIDPQYIKMEFENGISIRIDPTKDSKNTFADLQQWLIG